MRRSISPYIALLGLMTVGCKDDLKPAIASWTTATAEWQGRIDGLKADDVEQTQKIDGLCTTEGLDPGNVAVKSCADLKVSSQTDKAQLEALSSAMTRHRAVVSAALERGKRQEVTVSTEAAQNEITALFARVNESAQLRRDSGKNLEIAVTQELEAKKAAALVAEAKAAAWKQAAAEPQPFELTDIRFTKGTAELEAPEAGPQTQLQELVIWANSCPALTFSITAHESKELSSAEAKKITDGRASAVKKYLIDNGVAPTRIVSAIGSGSKKPIADEPAPSTPAATEMNPEDLEALRNKNRRITVQAVNVCPAGQRAELVAP